MKLLFFNWRDITHPLAGGCELHLHEIGKRLVEAGHEVTLFCGEYISCKRYDKVDGIEIIRRGGRYSVYLCAFLEYLTKLRKRNYDVVIDDINGVPFFTPLYVRRPKVAIIHHLVKDIFSQELNLLFRPFGYLAEWLIPKVYRKTCFITVSNSSREEMKEVGIPAENIKIIHNGISNNYKSNWRLKSPHPHIIYLGRLKDYKQLDHLIKAVKIVKDQIKDVELSIAGSGDNEDSLKRMAIELGVNTIIKFHGYVNEEKKNRLLQSAWIFVTSSHKEGWGCTVIEANACGTPAIAYDVPGLRDSIKNGETGFLVEGENVNYLASAIVRVLENDDLRGRLSRDAHNWSKNFSWDKSAIEFASVLEDISQSN